MQLMTREVKTWSPRNGAGKEAKLCYAGHVEMDNRHGLVVNTRLTQASGRAEPEAALAMVELWLGISSQGWCVVARAGQPHLSAQTDYSVRHDANEATGCVETRLVIEGTEALPRKPDPALLKASARAHAGSENSPPVK
jgi:hypothetical protein